MRVSMPTKPTYHLDIICALLPIGGIPTKSPGDARSSFSNSKSLAMMLKGHLGDGHCHVECRCQAVGVFDIHPLPTLFAVDFMTGFILEGLSSIAFGKIYPVALPMM